MAAADRATAAQSVSVMMASSVGTMEVGSPPLVRSYGGVGGTDVQEPSMEEPSGEQPSYSR
jgi:hypothetical protein